MTIGPRRRQRESPAGPARPERLAREKGGDGRSALVFVRGVRHPQPGITGEQADHCVHVAGRRIRALRLMYDPAELRSRGGS